MIDNLKKNVRNRTWWIAMVTAIIVLFKLWGIDLTDYIGKDWQNTINSICTIAVLLGISIDTTNSGVNTKQSIEPEPEIIPDAETKVMPLNDIKIEQIKQILNQ